MMEEQPYGILTQAGVVDVANPTNDPMYFVDHVSGNMDDNVMYTFADPENTWSGSGTPQEALRTIVDYIFTIGKTDYQYQSYCEVEEFDVKNFLVETDMISLSDHQAVTTKIVCHCKKVY